MGRIFVSGSSTGLGLIAGKRLLAGDHDVNAGRAEDLRRALADARGAGPVDAVIGRRIGLMHLVCYLRRGSDVFETYWTTRRGVEAMDNSDRLLDLTVYGRQEDREDSPAGWAQHWGETNHPFRRDGRLISQWRRLEAGYTDDLAADDGRR